MALETNTLRLEWELEVLLKDVLELPNVQSLTGQALPRRDSSKFARATMRNDLRAHFRVLGSSARYEVRMR
ncbi:hypothetical protein NDU88_005374 [Pleurodeles waltl]|uniref:Uncharacterized protein n=1 Tax=Pleurodeles waltl TaxID=8319 RepID=A0AAV7MZZ8_PLEWA|nr:hypothetical protein NDU88_005374 [Pleurodeles waltl]